MLLSLYWIVNGEPSKFDSRLNTTSVVCDEKNSNAKIKELYSYACMYVNVSWAMDEQWAWMKVLKNDEWKTSREDQVKTNARGKKMDIDW